ncbi:MAG: metal ABC transporter ATP-binding protein [Candidatus Avelusimicrobium sp.]|uniref:metal ABC transporter ATP-binding protein n=1 Tax=Candidatus Avelusimicrobium sp. TaxID=3048833 RepID=UPI003EFFCA99
MQSIICADNLRFAYTRTPVLEGVSFKITSGDYVGIIGPNGGGKTTLLKLLLGLERGEGKIELFGTPLARFKDWQKIGYLAQKSPVSQSRFPISAEEVVLMGLPSRRGADVLRTELKEVHEAMRQTRTREYAGRIFHDLSVGQQQRVLLARAIVSKPELLILDEPSTALDASSREMFFDLLGELNNKRGVTILLITHDTGEVGKYISKFMYVDKTLVFFGTKEEFCKSDKVAQKLGAFAQHTIDHLHNHGHCPLGCSCGEEHK